MKRYYFFKTDKYRSEERKQGIISFDLCALYSQDAYYRNDGKTMESFSYFDQLNVNTCFQTKQYDFKLDSGTDSCHGHWAKSIRELMDDKLKSGYVLVSEKDYNRLRSLAVQLMFKSIDKLCLQEGENRFAWCNDSYSRAWYFNISMVNYKYNRRGYSKESIENLGELYDHVLTEDIRIIIFKDNYKSSKFILSTYPFSSSYPSFQEALKWTKVHDKEVSEIQLHQYIRLRKLCKKFIFDYSELDIADIQKEQTHHITVLN